MANSVLHSLVRYSPPKWLGDALNDDTTIPKSRMVLSQRPTPIMRWNLSARLLPPELGVSLYVKRDDFTGMEVSGNKIRKLEFILADVKKKGYDCVVTLGGIQSNHCRATAVAANMVGLDAHVILRTSRSVIDEDPGIDGNLLIERMVGATIHLVTKEEYATYGQERLGRGLVENLKKQQKNPYLIVVGGSSMLGTYGYISMVEELEEQSRAMGEMTWDYVASACGSGGTTAGLGLGLFLSEYFAESTCLGYMVCDSEAYFSSYIQNIYEEMGFSEEKASDIVSSIRFSQAKGAGYAMSKKEELETIAQVARDSSILLDPVYTGKAFHALLRDIRENPEEFRGKNVLFCHTGGMFSYGSSQLSDMHPIITAREDKENARVKRFLVNS